jgi:hypothetical protein
MAAASLFQSKELIIMVGILELIISLKSRFDNFSLFVA